jgi:hypothetical protein
MMHTFYDASNSSSELSSALEEQKTSSTSLDLLVKGFTWVLFPLSGRSVVKLSLIEWRRLTLLCAMMGCGFTFMTQAIAQSFWGGLGVLIQQGFWLALWAALVSGSLWLCHGSTSKDTYSETEADAKLAPSLYEGVGYALVVGWGVWTTLNFCLYPLSSHQHWFFQGGYGLLKLVILWRIASWGRMVLSTYYPRLVFKKWLVLWGVCLFVPLIPWIPTVVNWMFLGLGLQLLKG